MTYLITDAPGGSGGGIPMAETMTNLSGVVSLVTEQQNQSNKTQPFLYIFTLIRGVDALSSRLQSALKSGQLFPFVNVRTPSGHLITMNSARITNIENVVRKGPQVNPGLGPLQAVTYTFRSIMVDNAIQDVQTYNWYALNN